MTLIVYANNRLYADDIALVDPKSINLQFRRGVKKIRVIGDKTNKTKELVVAVCGPFPWEKNWEAVAFSLRKIAYYTDQGMTGTLDLAFPTYELWQAFVMISNIERDTTYMLATKHGLYRLDSGGLAILDRNNEYCHGSGQLYYGICRKAGLSVEESYVKVAQYERTVGKLECNVDVSNLSDMVANVVAYMRKDGKNEDMAVKVEQTAARSRKELAQ